MRALPNYLQTPNHAQIVERNSENKNRNNVNLTRSIPPRSCSNRKKRNCGGYLHWLRVRVRPAAPQPNRPLSLSFSKQIVAIHVGHVFEAGLDEFSRFVKSFCFADVFIVLEVYKLCVARANLRGYAAKEFAQ